MSVARVLIPALCLLAAACGQSSAPAAGDAGQQAAVAENCDAPAVPLALGASATGEITQTSQPYPANARYYCVNVPAGVSNVTMTLSGMQTDLDLYVGSGNIASVQGINVAEGQTYQWKSNEFGNVDEHVTINTPQPGIYYAEIVSYQGEPSTYQFSAR